MNAKKLLEDIRYGIDYDAPSSTSPDSDYSTISGARIKNVDGVIPQILTNVPNNRSVWFLYAVDRLCAIHRLWDKGQYFLDIVDGYYGQEVGDITLEEKVFKAFEEDFKKIEAAPNNDELVFTLLEAEYGHVLSCLKGAKFSIKKVDLLSITFGQVEYYRKVCKQALAHYRERNVSFPQAIVLQVGKNKYRLIDGYHRLAAIIGQSEPVSVIVAKHGKG